MATCAACGHWAGRADEPCPHCGRGPKEKTGPVRVTKSVIDEIDAAIESLHSPGSRTPTTIEFQRWFKELDQSPVFAGMAPRPAEPPTLDPFEDAADEVEIPGRVETPRTAAAPVLPPLPTGAAPASPPVPEPPVARPVQIPPAPPASRPQVIHEEIVEPHAPLDVPVLAPVRPTGSAPVPVLQPVASPVLEPIPVLAPATSGAAELTADLRASYEFASVPRDEDALVHVLLTLTPDGPPVLDPATGPVAHVILCLDVSGSMNRTDKYPVLTAALADMLYDLKRPGVADVLLSVVLFAYGAETILRDVPASRLDPREVLRAIDRSKLRFGRYTDVVGALSRAGRIAYDTVQANKAMPVRIFLLTDGRPQDMAGARAVMEKIAKLPVDVDGFAFGQDADVGALQELVSGGRGGTVKQIRSDTIHEAFGRIPEAAASVVANRAVLEVDLAAGVAGGGAWRWRPARHRYGERAFADGRTFRTDLGTLEHGRPYSLLFQLRLPVAQGDETEVARVTVRVPGHGGPRVFETILALPRHDGPMPAADGEVSAARDVLSAIGASDPAEQIRALRVRRQMYADERRDPHLIEVLDRAIEELEKSGSLSALSAGDQAAILSHTCSVGTLRPKQTVKV